MKILIIFIGFLFIQGCATSKNGTEDDSLLIPGDLILSDSEIGELKKASTLGDCNASYKLFEYYLYTTEDYETALRYGELSLEQGCEKVTDEIRYLKNALGQ